MLDKIPSELLCLIARSCDLQTCTALTLINKKFHSLCMHELCSRAEDHPDVVGRVVDMYKEECYILKFLQNTQSSALCYNEKRFFFFSTYVLCDATPLLAAVSRNLPRVVRFLLEDIGLPLQPKLLEEAVRRGHESTVQVLLDNGASIHFENETALHLAARLGWKGLVKGLIKERKIDADVEHVDGLTALASICCLRSEEVEVMAELLLDLGANIDGIEYGVSPLACATVSGNFKMASWLLVKGATASQAAIDNMEFGLETYEDCFNLYEQRAFWQDLDTLMGDFANRGQSLPFIAEWMANTRSLTSIWKCCGCHTPVNIPESGIAPHP